MTKLAQRVNDKLRVSWITLSIAHRGRNSATYLVVIQLRQARNNNDADGARVVVLRVSVGAGWGVGCGVWYSR
jgi:hypothetical protein